MNVDGDVTAQRLVLRSDSDPNPSPGDGNFAVTGSGTITLTGPGDTVNNRLNTGTFTVDPNLNYGGTAGSTFSVFSGDDVVGGNGPSVGPAYLFLNGNISSTTTGTDLEFNSVQDATSSIDINGNIESTIVDVTFGGIGEKNLNGSSNDYSGDTLVTGGTLNVGGNLPSGTNVTVDPGATLDFSPGSIFGWSIDDSAADLGEELNQGDYNRITNNGSLSGSGAIFDILLEGGGFASAFWDSDRSWNDVLIGSGNLETIFSGGFSGAGIDSSGSVAGRGQFGFSGSSLSWTAVPEPSNLLIGGILCLGFLRRRR